MSDFEPSDCGEEDHRSSVSTTHLTVYEKSLLLDIIHEKKEIIESKLTDFGTKTKKDTAWKEIEISFCSAGGTTNRKADQLRTWWKNSKARAKKKVRSKYQKSKNYCR